MINCDLYWVKDKDECVLRRLFSRFYYENLSEYFLIFSQDLIGECGETKMTRGHKKCKSEGGGTGGR